MADKLQLLGRYWHHTTFRPGQEEVIDALLAGRDVLAMMPTGGGKSVCYQLPALMREGLCLVVSPLVSLMKDQVQRLNDMHLKAACLYAGMGSSGNAAVLNNAIAGAVKFLYVSPERLRSRMFVEHFRHMKVCLVAVDEAHCISQWGYDFRPPYLQIAEIRQYHPQVPLVALTATATAAVQDDICDKLLLRQPAVVRTSHARANLVYTVEYTDDKVARLLRVCQSAGEGCGIVYAGTRRRTESVAAALAASGVKATFYHAGLTAAERDARQALWMAGQCRVMVATNAFGMGIDKGDVRFVVHMDVPSSLEAYFQEAGRAGRDGKPSRAVMLCSDGDMERLERSFDTEFPPLSHVRNAYRALCNFYRLPLGSGEGSVFDFDIKAICDTYALPMAEFYSCCRTLEREGLISLPDDEARRSTLFIPLSRDELYRFQVDHMRMGDLLQVVIRLYPGLFTESTAIDEKHIAAHCLLDAGEVRAKLARLHDMKVVQYRPVSDKPQLVFCSERVDEKSICRNVQSYELLKSSALARLEAVRSYTANRTVCRSRQLLAYFGETEGVADCGRCDVCGKKRQDDADVEKAVLQAVAQGRLTVDGLCEVLAEQNYVGVEAVVRRLLDSGVLQADKNLFLSLP